MQISKTRLKQNWRKPLLRFGREITYPYQIAPNVTYSCVQECKTSNKDGIKHETPVPNTYTAELTWHENNITHRVTNTFHAEQETDLRTQIINWILQMTA